MIVSASYSKSSAKGSVPGFRVPFSGIARAFVVALAFSVNVFAVDAIVFVPATYPIGQVNQGDVKHIALRGANVSGKEIQLETVMGQGIGMSNFKYPAKVAPGAAVSIEFDMDFSQMEGAISPNVVMVSTDGTPYIANLEGFVKTPLFFSEKMFDAGYYKAGETREWTFYVWETDRKGKPDLALSEESAKDFSIKVNKVNVNVDEFGKVTEGGKIPALKVTLLTKGMSREGWEQKQKSLRKVVGFKSKKYPKATPEVLVIGYWN